MGCAVVVGADGGRFALAWMLLGVASFAMHYNAPWFFFGGGVCALCWEDGNAWIAPICYNTAVKPFYSTAKAGGLYGLSL